MIQGSNRIKEMAITLLIFRSVETTLRNLMTDNQSQKSGNDSTNLQAHDITINNTGITYEDARKIALDVSKGVLFELSENAKTSARNRVDEITDDFLRKLHAGYQKGLEKASDPGFQYALFTVQKEYARTGDKDLGSLLVDLLVDYTRHDQRNIVQIVLNESLNVAPKLTSEQIAILSVIFAIRYTQKNGPLSNDLLGQHWDETVRPFVDLITPKQTAYLHLEFTGCGTASVANSDIKLTLAR